MEYKSKRSYPKQRFGYREDRPKTQTRNMIQGLKGIRDRIDFFTNMGNVFLHS